MKCTLKIIFVFNFILLLSACSPPYSHTNSGAANITPVGGEHYLTENSDFIFNQDSLYTFELKLSEAALKYLDHDPTAEEYVEGSLTFKGETISPVGIRYKGSVGAFVNAVSGRDWANPSGRKTATKLSMKIKINWKDKSSPGLVCRRLQIFEAYHTFHKGIDDSHWKSHPKHRQLP